jgi:flagellar biosynthesis/type III secretory pathway M-ring protein FliF/YscJ
MTLNLPEFCSAPSSCTLHDLNSISSLFSYSLDDIEPRWIAAAAVLICWIALRIFLARRRRERSEKRRLEAERETVPQSDSENGGDARDSSPARRK